MVYQPPTTTNRPNQDRTIRIWIEAENTTEPVRGAEQTWEYHVAYDTVEGERIAEIRELVAHIDDALNRDRITPHNVNHLLAVCNYSPDTDRSVADIRDHPALDAVELPETVADRDDVTTVTVNRYDVLKAYQEQHWTAGPRRRVHMNTRTGDTIISSERTPPGYCAIDADAFVRSDWVDANDLIDQDIGGITTTDAETWRDTIQLRSELPADLSPIDKPIHVVYDELSGDRSTDNANSIPEPEWRSDED